MWLVLFVTLAHWAGYELIQRRTLNQGAAAFQPRWAIWKSALLIFYLALALGFLAKGPIAWVPLLTVAGTIIYARDWQSLRRFKFIRGILLVLGLVFISFFPWSIKLPWLVRKLWRERRAGIADPGYNANMIDNYLLTGVAVIFLIFTFVSTKLPHYTLPAFPLLGLLLARHWQGRAISKSAPAAGESRRSLFATIAMPTACVWVAVAFAVPLVVARFFPAYQLFQISRASLQPNMQFAAVEFQEPSLVWYFRSRVEGFLTPLNKRRAAEFMSAAGPRFIVLPTPIAGELLANPPITLRFFTVSGFNIVKGKRVDLTLALKAE
jgi:4-amino-4-deoxy-L-arabinose transferase-like glycosyltransferase